MSQSDTSFLPLASDIEEAIKSTSDFSKIDFIIEDLKKKQNYDHSLLARIETFSFISDALKSYRERFIKTVDQRLNVITSEIKHLQKSLRTSVSIAMLKSRDIEQEKMADQRMRTVTELFDTEKSYLKALEALIDKNQNCYETKFRDLARQKGTSQTVWDTVFSHLPEIYMVNKKFSQELEKCVEKWHKDEKIADLFLQWTSHFFVYNNFAANYYTNDRAIEAALKDKPYSEKFDGAAVLEFRNCYISPIQRLPRYEMILMDLLKNTPTNHAQYEKLCEAKNAIKNASKELNAHITNKQNEVMEKYIEANIGPTILTERKLLSFLKLKVFIDVTGPKARYFNNTFLFLFDDYLVASALLEDTSTPQKYREDDAFVLLPYFWISREITTDTLISWGLSDPKLLKVISSCIISGPRTKWIIEAADGKSGLEIWIEKVMPLLGATDHEQLEKGIRPPGKWFSYPGRGEYCGGFLNQKPNGIGMFKGIDGKNFKGMWDAYLDLGFGKISNSQDKDISALEISNEGWICQLNNKEKWLYPCKEDLTRDWSFWSPNPDKLNTSDWELLLTGTTVVQLNKKTKIFDLDSTSQVLYKIRSGSVRESALNGKLSHVLSVGDLLGIPNLLSMKNYSVLSCEEDTELYAIPYSSISKLLLRSQHMTYGLAYAFSKQLISCLASFFGKQTIELPSPQLEPKPVPDKIAKTEFEKKFRKRFGFKDTEVLFSAVLVKLGGKAGYGTIYLSNSHISYNSESLYSLKQIWKLEDIITLQSNANQLSFTVKGSKDKQFRFEFKNPDVGEKFSQLAQGVWEVFASQHFFRATGNLTRTSSGHNRVTSLAHATAGVTMGGEWVELPSLDENDLAEFQRYSEILEFEDNQPIVKAGSESERVMQVTSGSCKIQCRQEGEKVVVGTISTGDFICESILFGMPSIATIKAKGKVTIMSIRQEHVNILFARYKSFPARFYGYISRLIVQHIINFITPKDDSPEVDEMAMLKVSNWTFSSSNIPPDESMYTPGSAATLPRTILSRSRMNAINPAAGLSEPGEGEEAAASTPTGTRKKTKSISKKSPRNKKNTLAHTASVAQTRKQSSTISPRKKIYKKTDNLLSSNPKSYEDDEQSSPHGFPQSISSPSILLDTDASRTENTTTSTDTSYHDPPAAPSAARVQFIDQIVETVPHHHTGSPSSVGIPLNTSVATDPPGKKSTRWNLVVTTSTPRTEKMEMAMLRFDSRSKLPRFNLTPKIKDQHLNSPDSTSPNNNIDTNTTTQNNS